MRFAKRLLVTVIIIAIVFLTGCNASSREPDFSQINIICELATLKCYYHNFAKMTYEMEGFFSFLSFTNYKVMWIEYGGIVKVGIDASRILVENPNENGIVRVTMPKATVLEIDLDENSLRILSETGWFSSISMNERVETIGYAQDDMKRTAEENGLLLLQGQARAKKVIETYIQKIGSSIDKEYKIEWIDLET